MSLHVLYPAALQPSTLGAERAPRLFAALEILTVVACLALGVAFVGSLWSAPMAPSDATTRVCAPGEATPC